MKCVVCDKEIMAGKRCIECFMSKKKKVTEKPPSTVYPSLMPPPISLFPDSVDPEYIQESENLFTTSGTAPPPAIQAHTLTAVDTMENGKRVRRYKTSAPSVGEWTSSG